MRNPFEKAKTWWVRYSDYQWRTTKDGVLYIQPAPGATFTLYNAMEVMEQLVLDALNTGRKLMGKEPKEPFCPRNLRDGVIMGKEKRHTSRVPSTI